MPRKIIPLRPQKQVDQAIKNFILDKSHRETRVNLCLGGGTAISLKIFKTLERIELIVIIMFFLAITIARI